MFGINEESRKFSFSCQGQEKLDYLSNDKYIAILTRIGVVFREHDIGASVTTSSVDVEVGPVSMGSQNHIAGAIDNAVIGISHNVVKQL